MPYGNKNGKVNKLKEHTHNDRRYTLKNRVVMTNCPICTSMSLKEMNNKNFVWAECTSCGNSGENEKIQDNHLVGDCDIVYTLIDSYYG